MKTSLFTFLFITSALFLNAHPFESVLNITMFNNSVFTVEFDNQYFSHPDRHYTIQSVTPGQHHLRIMQLAARRNVNVPFYKLAFDGFVVIPAGTEINATILHHGQIRINNTGSLLPGPGFNPHCQASGYVNSIPSPSLPANCNVQFPMSDYDFNQLKSSLLNRAFESTRLAIAKQATANRYLSAHQVADLMRVFDFDSSRLEIARYAYGRTVDKQNYFLTYNSFIFESSINELNNYIDHFRYS